MVINSCYSFWWDVTHDWGFELLQAAQASPRQPPRPLILPSLQARNSSGEGRPSSLHRRSSSSPHPESPYPLHTSHSSQAYPWGLRPVLLFPLPLYPMAIFLNLLLRFTWSIKLSAHLHMSGALLFFWLEVAELLRRWVWVFFRVEWECVRKMNDRDWERPPLPRAEGESGEGLVGYGDRGESLEMGPMGGGSVVFDAGSKSATNGNNTL